jgi:hypothetical protein
MEAVRTSTSTSLYIALSQKAVINIVAAVRTLNLTKYYILSQKKMSNTEELFA